MWKGILAKIRPEAKPEPLPPLKHYEPPRAGAIPAMVTQCRIACFRHSCAAFRTLQAIRQQDPTGAVEGVSLAPDGLESKFDPLPRAARMRLSLTQPR
jgi:hypothetical protein